MHVHMQGPLTCRTDVVEIGAVIVASLQISPIYGKCNPAISAEKWLVSYLNNNNGDVWFPLFWIVTLLFFNQ